jgi:hypothetical protein
LFHGCLPARFDQDPALQADWAGTLCYCGGYIPLTLTDKMMLKFYHMEQEKNAASQNTTKLIIAGVGGVIILGIAIFAAYRYSQKQAGGIALPGGTTYLGPSPTVQPTAVPLKFTADATTTWNVQTGKTYPFSFSYPSTLPIVVFTNDPTDSIGIVWGNTPPQMNILANVEFIQDRDPKLVKQQKLEYVRNWYKFFSGLKGVASVQPFTNTGGMKGYKAQYVNYANTSPNLDVFFEVPNQPEIMIHMANGIIDSALFEKIIDSVKWTTPTVAPKR